MSCAVQLFLAGFCSFVQPADRQGFDMDRFAPAIAMTRTAYLDRIVQAFSVGQSPLALFDRHLQPIAVKLATLRLDSAAEPEDRPTLDVNAAPLAYASVSSAPALQTQRAIEVQRPNWGTQSIAKRTNKVRTQKRRDRLAMFRNLNRLPSGVDLRKSGYRAVKVAALRHGVDVNFALSVAKQESRGNCKARSGSNAKGVMQVVPGTARKHGLKRSSRLYNCKVGADIGVRELKSCLKKAKGNKPRALACYNAGPGWITSRKYRGKRLPSETRKYIQKITGKTYTRIP